MMDKLILAATFFSLLIGIVLSIGKVGEMRRARRAAEDQESKEEQLTPIMAAENAVRLMNATLNKTYAELEKVREENIRLRSEIMLKDQQIRALTGVVPNPPTT